MSGYKTAVCTYKNHHLIKQLHVLFNAINPQPWHANRSIQIIEAFLFISSPQYRSHQSQCRKDEKAPQFLTRRGQEDWARECAEGIWRLIKVLLGNIVGLIPFYKSKSNPHPPPTAAWGGPVLCLQQNMMRLPPKQTRSHLNLFGECVSVEKKGGLVKNEGN